MTYIGPYMTYPSGVSAGMALNLPPPTTFFQMSGAAGASEVDTVGGIAMAQTNNVGSAAGKVGNCRTFASASSQKLTALDSPLLRLDAPSTIAGWFNLTTKTASQVLFFKGASGSVWEYYFWYDQTANAMKFVASNGVAGGLTVLSNPSTGVWICFCLEWTGMEMRGAVNGGAFTTGAALLPSVSTGPLTVGSWGYLASGYVNGSIDALGFWRGTILNDTQWQNFYNAGVGREWVSGAWT